LLEQLQKPLSASPRQLPRGQSSSWDTGAGLDKRGRVRVHRARGGDLTHAFSGVISSLFVLHVLLLQQIHDLAHVMVYEYIRNRYIGQQVRELAKEERGESRHHILDPELFCGGIWENNARIRASAESLYDHTALG